MMGYLQVRALGFFKRHRGWLSFKQDGDTKRIIKSLEARGLIEINQFSQARLMVGRST